MPIAQSQRDSARATTHACTSSLHQQETSTRCSPRGRPCSIRPPLKASHQPACRTLRYGPSLQLHRLCTIAASMKIATQWVDRWRLAGVTTRQWARDRFRSQLMLSVRSLPSHQAFRPRSHRVNRCDPVDMPQYQDLILISTGLVTSIPIRHGKGPLLAGLTP